MAAVNARLPEVSVSRGHAQVGFGAEVEEQAQAFHQLQMLLMLAILLVYAVMASQYESLRDPFIIMFSVPLAAIGVVLALKLTGTTFSLQAYIGVIMLAGIVVSNAILLVDYTNILRRRDNVPLREAVETAGRTRLRPILMTSLATILGLVPMALGIGEGAELQAPLARVVIGGLAGVDADYAGVRADGIHDLRRRLERTALGAPQALVATADDIMKKLILIIILLAVARRPAAGPITCARTPRSRRSRTRRSAAAMSSSRPGDGHARGGHDRPCRHAGVGGRAGAVRRLQRHRAEGPGDRAARPVDPAGADRVSRRRTSTRSEADLERLRVGLADAKQKLDRAQAMFAKELVPKTDLESGGDRT